MTTTLQPEWGVRYVRGQLLRAGVAARRIRYEVFCPDLWLPGSPTA
ncbi:hypothetical protein OG985_05730 [Streptomyces sp. NBC_00289]